jgi:adenosylhomocysteine nucleosidase
MIAIISALGAELRPLKRSLDGVEALRLGSSSALRGRLAGLEVLLLATGVGPERAFEATSRLLDGCRVDLLLGIGFGGGLAPSLAAGDLVVAEEVQTPGPPLGSGPGGLRAAPDLLQKALAVEAEGYRLLSGRLLTVTRLLRTAAEKLELGSASGAAVADMESWGIARAAAGAGAPALFARAVVDEAAYSFPFDCGRLLASDGRLRPLELCRALAAPRSAAALWSLGRRSRRAASSIASFVNRFLEKLE